MIDPASVVALGLLCVFAAAALGALLRAPRQAAPWQRDAVWASLGIAALLFVWVVANRIVGLPLGRARPSALLFAGAVVVAAGLIAHEWRRAVLPAWRRTRRWYGVYAARADDVNVLLVAVAAAALRVAILFRAPAFVIGDSGVMVETVSTILERFSFEPLTFVFPPLYPLFLAGVRLLLGPDFLAAVAVQHALGIVTALCTYWLARMFLPPLLALLPALGVATNGYLLILEHGIYSEALFVPFAALFALVSVRLLMSGGRRSAAIAAALLALAALTRLVIQFMFPVVLVLMPIHAGWRRPTAAQLAVFGGAFCLVVAPWMIHNWVQYRYVGLSNSLGMQLLPRLWEEEGGYDWADTTEPDPTLRRALQSLQEDKDRGASWWDAWLRIERDFPERDTSALVTAAALDVIRRQPGVYLDRTWFRLKRMWQGGFTKERVHDLYGQQEGLGIRSPIFEVRDEPEFADVDEREGNRVDSLTLLFRPDRFPAQLTLCLTIAAAAGALVSRRLRPALLPLILGLGLLVIPVLLNADRARYLHPAEPYLFVSYAVGAWVIALGAARLWERMRLTLRTSSAPAIR